LNFVNKRVAVSGVFLKPRLALYTMVRGAIKTYLALL